MSASSPLPEDVRRDIERMAGPLAERMLPPKVTTSATTRNVVAAVNSDGTVDVMMGGAVMQRVPATTACVGVAAGDEVIVERYGPRLYCVGVVAKSLDNAAYVISDYEPLFEAYDSSRTPRAYLSGGTVTLAGSCKPTSTVAGSSDRHVMFRLPEGLAPPQELVVVCQGSTSAVWTMRVNADGSVSMERYRKGDVYADCSPSNWLGFCVSWALA